MRLKGRKCGVMEGLKGHVLHTYPPTYTYLSEGTVKIRTKKWEG